MGQEKKVQLMTFLLSAYWPQVLVQVFVEPVLVCPVWLGHHTQSLVTGSSFSAVEAVDADKEAAGATSEVVVEDGGGAHVTHLSHARVRSLPDHLLPCFSEVVVHLLLVGDHVCKDVPQLLKEQNKKEDIYLIRPLRYS